MIFLGQKRNDAGVASKQVQPYTAISMWFHLDLRYRGVQSLHKSFVLRTVKIGISLENSRWTDSCKITTKNKFPDYSLTCEICMFPWPKWNPLTYFLEGLSILDLMCKRIQNFSKSERSELNIASPFISLVNLLKTRLSAYLISRSKARAAESPHSLVLVLWAVPEVWMSRLHTHQWRMVGVHRRRETELLGRWQFIVRRLCMQCGQDLLQ